MQEVFEKIIEKLENLGWVFADYYPDGTNISRVSKKSVPYDEVVEIVKQEAEQYNNGWIPCIERLPEKLNHNVLVTYEDRYIGGIYGVCEGHINGLNEWHISDYDIDDDFNVIAWCEKPSPYQPKGE